MRENSKKVKKISPGYLKNLALWYLERFGGTRKRVRQTLIRRVVLAAEAYGVEPEAEAWVETVLNELSEAGLINDSAFASSRVAKGLRQGKSRRLIAQDLANAGVERDVSDAALAKTYEQQPDSEREAAKKYLRRRRLGRTRQPTEQDDTRDLAALARRGFSFEVARRALREWEEA